MPKAILWDNDGVLVDTEGLYFQAGCETMASMGVELTREAFIEQSLKKGLRVLVAPHDLTQHGDFSGAYRRLGHVRDVVDVVDGLISS